MSWTIEWRGRVAFVTMTTNPVHAPNRAFFVDVHGVFDRLERDHVDSPVVLPDRHRCRRAGAARVATRSVGPDSPPVAGWVVRVGVVVAVRRWVRG
ncbi:MAG: hypothetical protein QOD72_3463 [Acidimicrobiaceae bacterium]|jgi:hypothetical protein|nr:hypothetical protein [Acidimicrobiaceae bacterium]